jgi:RNA polymerase-binding transcription factor DksA
VAARGNAVPVKGSLIPIDDAVGGRRRHRPVWPDYRGSVMDGDQARRLLEGEQERLSGIRGELAVGLEGETEAESTAELSDNAQHQADVGTETFDRERDLSILEQVEAELADIEHALARLDDGTYGHCDACGAVIDDDRLEALPAARFCLAHQAAVEADARRSSAL